MRRNKVLRLAGTLSIVTLLAGCATSVPAPKVAYTGPVIHHSALTNKTVALITTTTGDQFNDPSCVTEFSKACRDTTLDAKTSIQDYNKLLSQALAEEGAKVVSKPPADIVIHTHMIPDGKHRYMFLLNYDIGHSMAMAMIPIYGSFSPRYYHVVGHMDDVVTVTEDQGQKVFSQSYPVIVRKQITGSDHMTFTYGGSSSKAAGVYLSSQDKVIQELLTDINAKLG